MNLLIDMGNSRIKWQLKQCELIVAAGIEDYTGSWSWLNSVAHGYDVIHVWASSVAGAKREDQLQAFLSEADLPPAQFAIVEGSWAEIQCAYKDYSKLGIDRWLAIIAGRSLASGAYIVVDSGTAITVDSVTADGLHQGGWIGPGVALMRRAMSAQSQALAVALREPHKVYTDLGVDTQTAIDGAITAMGRGMIEAAMHSDVTQKTLVLTGGDAGCWHALYPEAVWAPDLVFIGLEQYFAVP
ncbi:type III pantothenate kinase [Gilvimarinus agarilyticus]|uniref:type III pantothenate kinase n=1 Tax=Gilvimarinus sp. 2_MG-2023 TaxID=3062666 RepID=UPI001C0870C4|nr:type III pantothenate kinase [Gilvimarinus sp. 2_MG-2023]MBU2884557.1 type III pantothenate kinase [Gilvimarinus agarilyticus]MDO6569682.1 type III pantothenate kinase [Gilvimarinus sp. 2_MG-2023]